MEKAERSTAMGVAREPVGGLGAPPRESAAKPHSLGDAFLFLWWTLGPEGGRASVPRKGPRTLGCLLLKGLRGSKGVTFRKSLLPWRGDVPQASHAPVPRRRRLNAMSIYVVLLPNVDLDQLAPTGGAAYELDRTPGHPQCLGQGSERRHRCSSRLSPLDDPDNESAVMLSTHRRGGRTWSDMDF